MSAIISGLIILLLLCSSATQAADTGWVTSPQNDHARIRLRAMQTNETVDALLYIQLTSGWKTYWRSSGEARGPQKSPGLKRWQSSGSGLYRRASICLVYPHRATVDRSLSRSRLCQQTDEPLRERYHCPPVAMSAWCLITPLASI